MARPLLGLAVCFAGGCAVGDGLSLRVAAGLLVVATALLVLALAARRGRWAAAAVGAGALALGAAGAAVEARAYDRERERSWPDLDVTDPTPVELHGVARGDGRDLGD